MNATQALPWFAGAAARVIVAPGQQYPFAVLLAADPKDATPEALLRPGGMSALLTHEPGLTWPDQEGEDLARATLAAGGVCAFAFANLAGALACQQRLRGTGGRSGVA